MLARHSRRDYVYYRDSGWFESGYYYPTRLSILKRVAGSLCKIIDGAISSLVKGNKGPVFWWSSCRCGKSSKKPFRDGSHLKL